MAIGQHGVGQGPEMLSGLQFGRIGGQEQQMHMLGHAEVDAGMPAGSVEHENDLLGGTGTNMPGKGRQLHLEEGDADGGGQMEDCTA